jgi:hypothetical protein
MPLRNKSNKKYNKGRNGERTPGQIKEDNIRQVMEAQKKKRRNLRNQRSKSNSKLKKSLNRSNYSSFSNKDLSKVRPKRASKPSQEKSLSRSRSTKSRKKIQLGTGVPLRQREVVAAKPWK